MDTGIGKISASVIERWSQRRARAFFKAFIHELHKETPDIGELRARLDALYESDATSELIFEAYRAVSLSKSKTMGPRVIAVLTSIIIQRDPPMASDTEDLVLAAAESLSDVDFGRFLTMFEIAISEAARGDGDPSTYDPKHPLEVNLETSRISSSGLFKAVSGGTERISLMDEGLTLKVGLWAERLCSLGLMSESRTEISRTNIEGKSTFYAGGLMGAKRRIEWKVRFNEGAFLLRDLLRICGASP